MLIKSKSHLVHEFITVTNEIEDNFQEKRSNVGAHSHYLLISQNMAFILLENEEEKRRKG